MKNISTDENLGFVTKCGTFAAIPYVESQFAIIHNGKQIRFCKNIETAKKFISMEMKKLK